MTSKEIKPHAYTMEDIHTIRLMNSINSCESLQYRHEGLPVEEVERVYKVDGFDNLQEACFAIKNIIKLSDRAKNKRFTNDTNDRELLADIFTEIFINAHKIKKYLNI